MSFVEVKQKKKKKGILKKEKKYFVNNSLELMFSVSV